LRLNSDGTTDTRFGTNGVVTTTIPNNSQTLSLSSLALQRDGKIIAVGWNIVFDPNFPFTSASNYVLARYNGTDGSLDPSFGQKGVVLTDPPVASEVGLAVALQSADGKIVVGGSVYDATNPFEPGDFAVTQFNTDGSLDKRFGAGGTATTAFTGSR